MIATFLRFIRRLFHKENNAMTTRYPADETDIHGDAVEENNADLSNPVAVRLPQASDPCQADVINAPAKQLRDRLALTESGVAWMSGHGRTNNGTFRVVEPSEGSATVVEVESNDGPPSYIGLGFYGSTAHENGQNPGISFDYADGTRDASLIFYGATGVLASGAKLSAPEIWIDRANDSPVRLTADSNPETPIHLVDGVRVDGTVTTRKLNVTESASIASLSASVANVSGNVTASSMRVRGNAVVDESSTVNGLLYAKGGVHAWALIHKSSTLYFLTCGGTVVAQGDAQAIADFIISADVNLVLVGGRAAEYGASTTQNAKTVALMASHAGNTDNVKKVLTQWNSDVGASNLAVAIGTNVIGITA